MCKSFVYRLFPYIILFVVFTFSVLQAQVPNGDFENWTNGNPDSWQTNNVQGVVTPITQTSDAHSGSAAVRGEVLNVYNNPYPPILYNEEQNGKGFPINQRYEKLTGYYKLSPKGADKFLVWVYFWYKDQVIAGNYGLFGTASSYTQFSVPLIYFTADTPDSAGIWISVSEDTSQSSQNVNVGTVFYVDNLSLSGTATGINDNIHPAVFRLDQNYPNPFNPTTTIEYQIPKQSHVVLEIYNVLGNKVKTLVNKDEPAGNYRINFNASGLPSGVYLYRIEAGNFTQSKKLIVLK